MDTPEPCNECRNLYFGNLLEDKETREEVCRFDFELGKAECSHFEQGKFTEPEIPPA